MRPVWNALRVGSFLTDLCRFCVIAASVLLLSAVGCFSGQERCLAQADPFIGRDHYPQYRNLSGLAGGGYGTDAEGYRSLTGPTAFSTPTAYVMGHDQVYAGIANMSFTGAPILDSKKINGSAAFTYGHTFGQFNVAFTEFIKSEALDQAYNLQVGIIPLRRSQFGFSIGVQDALGLGGSAGEGIPTDRRSSRTVFFALTQPVQVGRKPLYLSAGWGTHRFNRTFASASYHVGGPLRTWVEYDGFGFNEGILLASRVGRGKGSFIANANVGFIRGRYFIFGVGGNF